MHRHERITRLLSILETVGVIEKSKLSCLVYLVKDMDYDYRYNGDINRIVSLPFLNDYYYLRDNKLVNIVEGVVELNEEGKSVLTILREEYGEIQDKNMVMALNKKSDKELRNIALSRWLEIRGYTEAKIERIVKR